MKTFERCCDEVANKYQCSDWEMLMINLNQSDIKKTALQVATEAAELYAKEVAIEAVKLARYKTSSMIIHRGFLYTEQEILEKLKL